MNELPQIRLEVEGMKYTVVHYLGKHHAEVEESIAQQLDHIINTFDFAPVVRDEALRQLDKWIKSAVSWAIADLFRTEEVLAEIQRAIRDALVKVPQQDEKEQDGKETSE